ncbi:MAG TPA: glycosyltransferase family 4 protein [Butyricimonas virosa]|uniref:Glycosyltransferase family 4 protein n=1 Tax=Butyricimonas virosa TaxID=544645 RepID=A0A921KYZ4_9BACT|nr:glycosyltransferase family 4 protein [Butyricimonas virosa]
MKLLYIHQYFKTPEEPGGTRSYWISQELIKRGHRVVMITGSNKNHPDSAIEHVDGIEVHYIKNEYNNYMSALSRIKSFISFMFKAIGEGCRQKDVDLVFATSTPLTTGAVAIALKWLKGWKYVFEVRDLWPEALIQEGVDNPVVMWALRLLEKMSYRKAEHVISLSPGMEEGVLKVGISKSKSTMIPNMAKPDKFYPRSPSPEIMAKFDIDIHKFNIIHFGSMGASNGLGYIVNAAKVAQERGADDLNFVFLGDGSTQPMLKDMVKGYGLRNVQFLGDHGMEVVSEIVNCCDASIVSFNNVPILATNSPNKLFDSLSAGKPVIVNSSGWTKDLVEKDNCGFFVDPDNPNDLVDKLLEVKDNKELLKQWGENSRRLSLEVYDKSLLSAKVANVLENAIK